jgi:hypothetical protein
MPEKREKNTTRLQEAGEQSVRTQLRHYSVRLQETSRKNGDKFWSNFQRLAFALFSELFGTDRANAAVFSRQTATPFFCLLLLVASTENRHCRVPEIT